MAVSNVSEKLSKRQPCTYLMSRFFLITTQTKEFPMILVMISTAVTIVTAISADSDMTMSVLVTITESITDIKKMNTYLAIDLLRPFTSKERPLAGPLTLT